MPADRSSASSTSDTIEVCETFASICGESTWQGLPAFFIRTAGCNLRCSWCDTQYAWSPGENRSIASLTDEVENSGRRLVVITGGEPLLQAATPALIEKLLQNGHIVLLETNGTMSVADLPQKTIRIIDVKMPSAKAAEPFCDINIAQIKPEDELKFVIADRGDFAAAEEWVAKNHLEGKCELLLSPVHGRLSAEQLAEWMLGSSIDWRLQVQLHKILWGSDVKGR